MEAALQSTSTDAPKKRGRPPRTAVQAVTIPAWFGKALRSPTPSNGGLATRGKAYRETQTIDAYNAALVNKLDYQILDQSLIGQYSPFVLSLIEVFSQAAQGLPQADKEVLHLPKSQREALLAAMQSGVASGKKPLSDTIVAKLKTAGILYYAQVAALKPEDRFDYIDVHVKSLTRDVQNALNTRHLQPLETVWFDQRLASRHRRVTIDAEEASYYTPERNMYDLCEIVRNCDGAGFSKIIQPTARLSAIATENALRIAFEAHSCVTRLTLAHGRNADILGYTAISDIGRTVTEALQVNGMEHGAIKTVERHLAQQLEDFERDRTKTIWTPRQV